MSKLDPAALERLFRLEHHDPHAILGIHPGEAGAVLRCWRPDAVKVSASLPGQKPLALAQVDPRGLWQGSLPAAAGGPAAEISATYADGQTWVTQDPYSFEPTLSAMDLHLLGEGTHWSAYQRLGSRLLVQQGVPGVAFAVWAPGVRGVSVVGELNRWDGRLHPMRSLGGGGIWELFVPGLGPGQDYKYEIHPQAGPPLLKADPYAQDCESPPATASRTFQSRYAWKDQAFLDKRQAQPAQRAPMSIYEVHLGSWKQIPEHGPRPLSYLELAQDLADYAAGMGFTHVELMPIMEHPYGPSWGYQVGSYFAPTHRYGSPDELRALIDALHQKGLGVLLDWVPAHFPKDAHVLGRFTGEAVYEHASALEGEHPDWGTYIFNFGRNEVRNFLISNALFWLKEFHIDGLRIDAVASMLYRDYSRKAGEWVANADGGRENLEAIHFMKRLNEEAHAQVPGCLMVAEESTAWPGVSRPTYAGGLGFGFKWNMGWMHDTLDYFSKDPVHRVHHHHNLTFGFLYAWSENFILPISHDEVVHGKGSLLNKMPGDRWQKFANLRSFYGYMWSHPGKKLLFMGCEFGQWQEWKHDASLDWHLLQGAEHAGLQRLVRDLNQAYRVLPALYDLDGEPGGFEWLESNNASDNVIAFVRRAADTSLPPVISVGNFSPVPRLAHRIGLPAGGRWIEWLNTDATTYGGSGLGNQGHVDAEPIPWQGQPFSAEITLPPLAVVWLVKD